LDFNQHIVSATTDVFNTMIMLEARPGPPLSEKRTVFGNSISALLGLSGVLQGMLCIHCPEQGAKVITANLLGMDIEDLNEDVNDAMGELANMIAGGLKTRLTSNGEALELSIPTAIAGASYTVNSMSAAASITVPFAVEDWTFLVELRYVLNSRTPTR